MEQAETYGVMDFKIGVLSGQKFRTASGRVGRVIAARGEGVNVVFESAYNGAPIERPVYKTVHVNLLVRSL